LTKPRKSVCVFCVSSSSVAPHFFQMATELGRLIGVRGCDLIYGGTVRGLMLTVAENAQKNGSQVTGVIPEKFVAEGFANHAADELITTGDMRSRRATMIQRAEAFLILPGGFGKLEEFFEVLSLKLLRELSSPIVILNHRNFFTPLLDWFDQLCRERFASATWRDLVAMAAAPGEALDIILKD
jgi:uncharacterized protein (TIGR00730 family)